jgi:hypothetical protein
MAQWEEEWRTSGSTVSIQWFIMEKTADFAADADHAALEVCIVGTYDAPAVHVHPATGDSDRHRADPQDHNAQQALNKTHEWLR